MKSNDGLKQTDIKNHTCYYFGDIININDLDLENIFIDKNSYENVLIYDVAYKFVNTAFVHSFRSSRWIYWKI